MLPVELNGAEVRTLQNHTTGSRLHVIAARGMVFSSWRFSPEELAAVKLGKPVWVVIRGEIVPEFHLQAGDRNEVVPPEIIKRAQQKDAILNSPEAVELVKKQKREDWLVTAVMCGYVVIIGGALLGCAVMVVRAILGR